MKHFLKLLLLLLTLLLLVYGFYYYQDHVLHIRYATVTLSPSLPVALALLLVFMFIFYFTIRIIAYIITTPARLREWSRLQNLKQSQQLLTDALRGYVTDNPVEMKDLANKCLSLTPQLKQASHLMLARLSHDTAVRRKYLEGAMIGDIKHQATKEYARLLQAYIGNEAAEALSICNTINVEKCNSLVLLRLMVAITRDAKAEASWSVCLRALYRIDELTNQRFSDVTEGILPKLINRFDDAAALQQFWKNIVHPTHKSNTRLLRRLVLQLHRCGEVSAAQEVLAGAMKKDIRDGALLSTVAEISNEKYCQQTLERFEKEGGAATDLSADVYSGVARLAQRIQLWGKAQRYYTLANAKEPSRENYANIANLLEKLGRSADEVNTMKARGDHLLLEKSKANED